MNNIKKYIALLLALLMLCIPLTACSGSDKDAGAEDAAVSEEADDADDADDPEEEPATSEIEIACI